MAELSILSYDLMQLAVLRFGRWGFGFRIGEVLAVDSFLGSATGDGSSQQFFPFSAMAEDAAASILSLGHRGEQKKQNDSRVVALCFGRHTLYIRFS